MRRWSTHESGSDSSRPRARIIRYRTIGALLADYERNLSRGAFFLNTRRPLRLGARVRLILALARPALKAGVDGKVVRVSRFGNGVNEAPGGQVAITEGRSRRRLTRLVEALQLLPGA